METRFEFKDFAKVFALGITLYSICVTLFGIFPQITGFTDLLHPTLSFAISYSIQISILFLPLYLFVIKKYQASFADFGFQKTSIAKIISYVFSTYIFYFIVTAVISTYLYTNQVELPGYQGQESHLPLFGTDVVGFVGATFFVVFLAPVLEEIFFRGFVYRILVKTWSVWFGSIMSAVLFALFHFEFQSFIPLLLLGFLLNFNYQKTGSLWTSICFHSMNNAIALSMEVYLYYHPNFLNELVKPLGLL